MKTLLCTLCAALIISGLDNSLYAKGCSAGHCVHYVGGTHHSPYSVLHKLHDSTFAGYIVVKQDTLYGRLSNFNSYGMELNDGKRTRRINYSRIIYMHLGTSGNAVDLSQLPGRSGFFRVLYSQDGIALYDRDLSTCHTTKDAHVDDLVFSYGHFNRYLKSDFSGNVRKSIVPIINQHYAANISRKTTAAEVYRLILMK